MAEEPYVIEWTGPAKRALARLPEKVASAVVEFVYGVPTDHPQRAGRPLRFELEGLHGAHRGDFRVVYRIAEQIRTVYVVAIGHRADIYRPS